MDLPELQFDADLPPLTLYPGPLLIGRAESCDRRIPHGKISKKHAVIERTDQGWFIIDAGSTNGTDVDGQSAIGDWQLLHHGAVIRLGGLIAHFHAPELEQEQRAVAPAIASSRMKTMNHPTPKELRNSKPSNGWSKTLWTCASLILLGLLYSVALDLWIMAIAKASI